MSFDLAAHLRQIEEDAYLFAMFEEGETLPDGKGGFITFDTIPQPLYWWQWTEHHGNPYSGGWHDQPLLFTREIEAARRGYARRTEERELRQRQIIPTLLSQIRDLLANR